MKTKHHHRVKDQKSYCFSHCACPADCNPASHGYMTIIETCRCGATRMVNANGLHRERGEWVARAAIEAAK